MIFDINALIDSKTDDKIGKSTNRGMSNFATVTGVTDTGTVFLRFDGETEPSKKQYQRLSGYIPQVGDRVLLMRHSGTVLVIDKVVGIPMPFPLPAPDPPTTFELKVTLEDIYSAISASVSVDISAFSEDLSIREMTTGGGGNRLTDTYTPITPHNNVAICGLTEELTAETQIQ